MNLSSYLNSIAI